MGNVEMFCHNNGKIEKLFKNWMRQVLTWKNFSEFFSFRKKLKKIEETSWHNKLTFPPTHHNAHNITIHTEDDFYH
jgi:hypothetical protein